MVAVDEADALDLGPDLDDAGGALELQVLMKPLGVVLVLVPPRRPGLDDAEAEANWMRFLVWMALGLVIYFSYSVKNSKLNTP